MSRRGFHQGCNSYLTVCAQAYLNQVWNRFETGFEQVWNRFESRDWRMFYKGLIRVSYLFQKGFM